MDILTSDPGLLIVGAVGIIIIVAAYFVGKILAKGQKSKNSSDIAESGTEKGVAQTEKVIVQPEWKVKRSFLQRIRDRRKKESGFSPEITVPGETRTEILEPGLMGSYAVESENSAETFPIHEVDEPTVSSFAQAAEAEADAHPEPEQVKSTDAVSNLFADLIEKPDEKPLADVVEEVKEEKKKEKSSGGGDIFSMFTDEDDEEDEKSKFASSLDAVSIDDLLDEIRDLRKFMRK